MVHFLDAYTQDRQLYPGLLLADQLDWEFYQWAKTHCRPFLQHWFAFDSQLKNVIAGLTYRDKYSANPAKDRTIQHVVVGDDEVAGLIRRSAAPDFSLSAVIPWVDTLLTIDRSDFIGYEKALDDLRWQTLDNLTTFSYFSIDAVLAFCIKLAMVDRWLNLDPQIGKQRFEQLVDELDGQATWDKF